MTPAHLDMDKCMTIHLDYELPEYPAFEEGYRRAPRRESHLTEADKILAIKNALRYIHPDHHEQMAKEFAQELEEHGRIYGYRFRPEGKLYGKPIDEYKGNCMSPALEKSVLSPLLAAQYMSTRCWGPGQIVRLLRALCVRPLPVSHPNTDCCWSRIGQAMSLFR